MLQRVITALVGLIIFFAILLTNETVFFIAVAVVAVGMLYELFRATKAGSVLSVLGVISAVAGICSKYFLQSFTPAIVFSIMVFLIASVYLHGKVIFQKIYSTAFISWYVVIFMSTIASIRENYGIYATILVFICAWMTDVGAYFAGYFFGKHKLIPNVSPKKTVEGAIGGVVVTVISCLVYTFIILPMISKDISLLPYFNPLTLICLAIVASVLSQFGDLIASVIKRECNIKDFGTLFPGHGGMLDRFDSVVFIAPFVYYFINIISKLG